MIKISKDLLKTEYLINKLNRYEIGSKYGYTAVWINILRRKYKIRTIKPYERNLKQELSKKQQEYLYGSLLGDGSIKFGIAGNKRGNKNGFFSICQSCKTYAQFQYLIMQDFVKSTSGVYCEKRPDRKEMYCFRTISHPIFTNLYKRFYPNGVKTISFKWLKRITPFSLAIWYMDDGSITQSNHYMRVSTESFSYQEHLLIQEYFEKKWRIFLRIKSSPSKNKFVLSFKGKERDKFFKLIEPYILPDIRYKLYNNKSGWEEWTNSEIDYLKRNYLGWQTNWKNILQTLNHSKEAIYRKASYLNLTNRNKL